MSSNTTNTTTNSAAKPEKKKQPKKRVDEQPKKRVDEQPKKKVDEKKKITDETAVAIHPGLFYDPKAPKHLSLHYGSKMFLKRYPTIFYPHHDNFKWFQTKWNQDPDWDDFPRLIMLRSYRTVPQKVYLWGHIMTSRKTKLVDQMNANREKTHKLEVGTTYSIPDVGNFKIDRKIGYNGYAATSKDPRFGRCYLAFEADGRERSEMPCQALDARFYLGIRETAHTHRKHFLQLHCFGLVPFKYHWSVFELGGPNLEDLFIMCDRNWSRSTIVHVAAQTLQGIHDTQLHHHMHRCIDPASFIVGAGDKHKIVYIIDFSHSYEYTERTRRQRKGEKFGTETPRVRYNTPGRRELFAPRVYHTGGNYRRIDDVESWMYMFIYWMHRGNHAITENNSIRDMYHQKCHWMYGGYFGDADPLWNGFALAMIHAIDQYDEAVNSVVDFPYFATCLENIAVVWGVTKQEQFEWMPHSRDPAQMVLRREAINDAITKIAVEKGLGTATLILPEEKKNE